MPSIESSYSSIVSGAYRSQGILDDENALTTKLRLYYSNPDYFTRSEAEELESRATSNGIYFRRAGEHATDDTGVIQQFVSGMAEGAILLGWADEPDTDAEKIASKIGHLVGFAGDVIALALTGGASATLTAGKFAAKTVAKKGISKASMTAADKLKKAAGLVTKYTQKGGGFLGRKGPVPLIGTFRSIPMRAADWAMMKSGLETSAYFAKGMPAHMLKTGMHLGIASAVSSIKEGPRAVAESFAWGGVAGAAFGGIGQITRTGQLLAHKNPKLQMLGKDSVRRGAGALLGAGFQGGIATALGAPTEDQIYEYLLGAVFGGAARSAHETQAGKFITDKQQGKVNPETGRREGAKWGDIYEYKDSSEWDTLSPRAKDYVKDHIKKLTGSMIPGLGTDVYAVLAKEAELSNKDISEVGERFFREKVRAEARVNIDPETGLKKEYIKEKGESKSRAQWRWKKESKEEIGALEEAYDIKYEPAPTNVKKGPLTDRIGTIEVPEKYRKQYIGKRFFDAIKKDRIARGKEEIFVHADQGAKDTPVEFWRKLGFKKVGMVQADETGKQVTRMRYDLSGETEKFNAEFKGIDYEQPSASVEHYNKERQSWEEFTSAFDEAGFEDLGQFNLPRNKLDNMASDIAGAHPKATEYEIRKNFHEIRDRVNNNYEKFVAALSKKYPNVRLNETDVKQFLLKDTHQKKVRQFTWNQSETELRETEDYDFMGKRTIEMKPLAELDKRFGPSEIGPIKRVEIQRDHPNGKMRKDGTPWQKKFQYGPLDQIFDDNLFEYVDVIDKKGWQSMQSQLDAKGHYIMSARKDDNVLVPYKYHPEAEALAGDMPSFVKRLERAGFKDIAKDIKNDYRGEVERYHANKMNPIQKQLSENVFNKKVISNFLWARDLNNAQNLKELNSRWDYKNVIDYNKRVSLLNGGEIPMEIGDFNKPGDKFLNKNNMLEAILVEDSPANGLVKGKEQLTFKTIDGKTVPYTSQLDGVIELPPDMFSRVLNKYGYEKKSGFMKPVMVINHPEFGQLLVKAGAFKTSKEHLKLSGKNRAIIWTSSAKTTGGREPDIVRYDAKTKKWDKKPVVYEFNPEDMRINLGVYESKENALKTQQFLKQMFGYANPEQSHPVDIDLVYESILKSTIEGYSDRNGKFIYNDLVNEFFLKQTDAKRKTDIEQELYSVGEHWPDRLSRKVILDLLDKNPDSRVSSEFLRYIFEKGKKGESTNSEWVTEQQSAIEEMAQMTAYEKILKASKYRAQAWLYDSSVRAVVEKSVENYLTSRMVKPRWRGGGSGKAYVYPYTVDMDIKPQDFLFSANWKDPDVKISWRVSPGNKKVPLVDAWNQYQDAVKPSAKTGKRQLKIMEEDLEFLFARSPMGGLSGARLFKLKGFSKEDGWGIHTHPKDDFYLGGVDKDGDAAKFFQGLPKEFKSMFRNSEKDLELPNGRALDIKDPVLDKLFGIDPTETTAANMSRPGSAFMPNFRIEAGKAAYTGKRNMGTIENTKQQLQIMLSTLNATRDKKKTFSVHREGKYKGELTVEVRKESIIDGLTDDVIGDTFRYFGYNASNRATDASNYPKMNPAAKIRDLLSKSAFKMTMVNPQGHEVDNSYKFSYLKNTELGMIADVNNRLYSKNWAEQRGWKPAEIQDAVSRFTESSLPWQGHLSRMARDIAGQHIDLDPTSRLDPIKVQEFFRDKTREYQDAFSKDLMGRLNLSIAKWNLEPDYFTKKENAFKFGGDIEDVAGADLVIQSGKKAYDALLKSGKTDIEAVDVLHTQLRSADKLKNEADQSRAEARDPNVSSAGNKLDIATEIRSSREGVVDAANSHGVDPMLFLRYWDLYFVSPLRYQSPEMRSEYNGRIKKLQESMPWFEQKFGKKISESGAEKIIDNLPESEANIVRGVIDAIRMEKNELYRTDLVPFARETNEIPFATVEEYVNHKADLIRALERAPAPKLTEQGNEAGVKPSDNIKEAFTTVEKALKISRFEEFAPDYEKAIGKAGVAKKTLDPETKKHIDELVALLSDPKNGPIKDDFAKFFVHFTAEHEPTGRPVESMKPTDIVHLNNYIKLSNSPELMMKYVENHRGEMVPALGKWMHHALYSKVGDHMFFKDRRMIERYGVPLRQANGELIFVKGKQPVSSMTYTNENGQQMIRFKDKFVNSLQEARDREFGFLLEETIVNDQFDLFELAIKKKLKDGTGAQQSKEDRAYYKEMWIEAAADYSKLQKKGDVYRFIGKDGKQHFYNADKIMDVIIRRADREFGDIYKKWVDPFMGDEVAFDKQFKRDSAGKMLFDKGSIKHKAMRGVLSTETLGDADIVGIKSVLKIEHESVMEAVIKDQLDIFRKQTNDYIKVNNLTGNRKRSAINKGIQRQKELRNNFRAAVGPIEIGFIDNYWPQLGHMMVKANQKNVMTHINDKTNELYKSIIENPKKHLNDKDYLKYELGMQGKPGGRTLEELALRQVHLLDSRMQKFLGRDTMKDGGDLEPMINFWEKQSMGDFSKKFVGQEAPEMVQHARDMGFFAVPGNLKRRGIDFIPHFRTDADVMKIYTERMVTSYFNHLFALQTKDTIDSFIARDPMGKVKAKNAKGEDIEVDLTADWADIMRDVAKKVLGYPTHFTTEKGQPNATYIGHSRRMMGAYKRTLKTGKLNRLSRDKINATFVAQGRDPIPKFESKKAEDTWLRDNQVYVDVLNSALKERVNPLQVYGSGYYYTSDTMMVDMIQKVGEKIAGRDNRGNIILPWKHLPTDPDARRAALTSMVHKFGAFEAKWSLATLLTHPKTAIGNIFGGSFNTITSASFRHWKSAGDTQYLLRNVFADAKLANGKRINSKERIGQYMEEIGALESFYVQEIGLDPTYSQSNRKAFMNAVVKKMGERGLFKSGITDKQVKETVVELAQKYKVGEWVANKAAFFMRVSERPLRQRAFLAHYLNAREGLFPISQELPFDSPWLLSQAIKGVTSTQFLYNSAARSNYSNTAIGKVMTRFQPFAWNSIAFRKNVYRNAKVYGFTPGTKDFNRLQRQMTADLFVFALGNIFTSSIFEYSMPPPMSWLQDTAQFFFGDEKERERAFFSQWPLVSKKNILAPLQPFTGPIMRYPLNTLALFTEGGLEKFSSYYAWTWFPFGRMARDLRKTVMSPAMVVENATGFPLHKLHVNTRAMLKSWSPEEEAEQ